MRKFAIFAVLALLVLTGAWLVMGSGSATSPHAPSTRAAAPIERVVSSRADDVETSEVVEPSSRTAVQAEQRAAARAERDALHERITSALRTREPAARPAAIPEPEPTATPGNLTDRTGQHGYLLDVMNRDLIPLADECYALAREADPELAGLLEINIEIIGDDELGGVIEVAEPAPSNELPNADLIECVRESLLSTTLPPPPTDGRDALKLSLRLEPES